MTTANLDLNKRACELLGIERGIPHYPYEYPDFCTDSGKVDLLRLMAGRIGFFEKIGVLKWDNSPVLGNAPEVFIHAKYITEKDTGLLLRAAVEWMEGRNEGNVVRLP